MKEEAIDERRFTLRIGLSESKAIEELKTLLGENTDSAVVRNVIINFANLSKSLMKERQKNTLLTQERDDLIANIRTFCNAFEQLNFFNKKKK